MRAHHAKVQGVKYCIPHDERFAEGEDCPECVGEDEAKAAHQAVGEIVARNRRIEAARANGFYCEAHDEIFENACPRCAMWRANILDQDAEPTAKEPLKYAFRYENKATGRVFYTVEGSGIFIKHPEPTQPLDDQDARDLEAFKKLMEAQSGGVKFDQNKPPVSLVDRHAIEQIANVLAFGAKKYAAHNWRQGIAYSRLLDAALRHLFAFADGEDNDPESGLSHIAHAGCCVVFLLGMMNTRPDLDDRFKATT